MRRVLAVLLLVLLSLSVSGLGMGCSLVDESRSETTAPIPDDPRVRAAVEILRPSVVEVRASSDRSALVQEIGLGTGVVVREDGLVVTNDHVITMGGTAGGGALAPAQKIEVRLAQGRRVDAVVVARAPEQDLAFLQVDETGLSAAVLIQDLDQIVAGQLVVAIGAAENLQQPVTVGQVTGLLEGVRTRTLPHIDTLIRSNVPLSQGNSGGPLADEQGRVLGINVAVTLGNQEGQAANGSSLAIPAPAVLELLERLGR